MRDIHEVLQQKEADIERLNEELQALHIVASLLEEEDSVRSVSSVRAWHESSSVQEVQLAAYSDSGPSIQPTNDEANLPPKKHIWSWGRLNLKKNGDSAA